MGVYAYIRKAFQKQTKEELQKKLIVWRREESTVRLDHPTRIDRARNLGYKAKQGYFVVRQRVPRGGHYRPHYRNGKKPRRNTSRMVLDISYRRIAEMRVARKYKNCEVLNSYYVAKDGQYYWHEVIMVDKAHPSILNDKKISWIARPAHNGRVFRGLTSAGRKGRALQKKGKGVEKARPSQAAHRNRL
jgi:large subunit ribosomal protein L15e